MEFGGTLMRKAVKWFLCFCFFMFCCSVVFAQTSIGTKDFSANIVTLVFQLAVILFAARIGGIIFERFNIPSVLGEIMSGVVIGPYFLGHIPLPGFANGLFPLVASFPVSSELYSIATIASIVLLFLVGLETDLETFLSFSFAGLVVGIGGVIFSFVLGDLTVVLFSKYLFSGQYSFTHPLAMFMGVVSTATSVGITARILSERKKMDSPEGVTILSGAIVDDVLGIVVLSVILGIIKSGNVSWPEVSKISLKAVGTWIFFTFLGLTFAHYIGNFLKRFRDKGVIAVMGFALAMLLAGIFEKSGLAMIIGAYIMGLSISKTDIAFLVQENLSILSRFFVPIFFCVMGMLVDFGSMFSKNVLIFGIVYISFAVFGKIVGCSIPALFLNFNFRGALRVGVGMIPRGEVALIVAGIGLSSGILNSEAFSAAILMTFVTTLLAPPVLTKMLSSGKTGVRKKIEVRDERKQVVYDMPDFGTGELILNQVLEAFEDEGFYIHLWDVNQRLYQIRKHKTFITMRYVEGQFIFDCLQEDEIFIDTVFYEVLANVERIMRKLKGITSKEEVAKRIFDNGNGGETNVKRSKASTPPIHLSLVRANLKSDKKEDLIIELVNILVESGKLNPKKRQDAIDDLLERETAMSTGMQDGIALPHAKTNAVSKLVWVFGVKKGGLDFNSLDKKPSNIFVLTLAPNDSVEPYLQFMAEISKLLMDDSVREKILGAGTDKQLCDIINEHF